MHKIIICNRSRFFKKAFKKNFEVVLAPDTGLRIQLTFFVQEGIADTLELVDNVPEIIARVLQYLYTLDYEDSPKLSSGQVHHGGLESASIINTLVYAAADKYEVAGLKEVTGIKFEKSLKEGKNSCSTLAAIPLVYSTTPFSDKGLRQILLSHVYSHRVELQTDAFASLLSEEADFAADVVFHTWTTMMKAREPNSSNAHNAKAGGLSDVATVREKQYTWKSCGRSK